MTLPPRRLISITPSSLIVILFLALSLVDIASAFASLRMSHPVDAKLKELGITLPPPTTPKGNYAPLVRTGNLLHLSGHLPLNHLDGSITKGKVGADLTTDQGYEAARACAIQMLATLHQYLDGDWSRITKIVKVVGFVACTNDFDQQPAVINGASDLFVQVLGKEVGMHARSAVGTNALPLNIATEVEGIVEIRD